jgi:hypothetical protein
LEKLLDFPTDSHNSLELLMRVNYKKLNLNRTNFGLYGGFENFSLFHFNIGLPKWKNSIQIAAHH